MQLSLDSIDLVENNHVGNEWGFQADINKYKIKTGDSLDIKANLGDEINLSATAEEYDNIPDIGSNNICIRIDDLKLTDKNNYPIEVPVTENRGRYAGNSAIWRFNFTIVRKVTFKDIIKSIF